MLVIARWNVYVPQSDAVVSSQAIHFLSSNVEAVFRIRPWPPFFSTTYRIAVRHNKNPNYAALGASGGVSAVVFAAILFEPWQNLYLFGVIAIPQILASVAYLFYSWYKDKKSTDNIGHMAHFTGAVWGFLFTGFMNFELFTRFLQKTLHGPGWL